MTDYCSFNARHIGKSHMTSGLPCQDCSFSWNEEALTVAIVADGHGSSAFVRSDKGSRFAVFAATKAITEFTESLKPADGPEAGSGKEIPDDWQDDPGPKGDWTDSLRTDDDWNEAMDLLCRNILRRWYELVDKDCRENPFTPEEVKDVPEKYRDAYLAGKRPSTPTARRCSPPSSRTGAFSPCATATGVRGAERGRKLFKAHPVE